MSHFLLFPDSPEAQKAKKKPRIVELVSYASSPEKQGSRGRLSPDSDIEMFEDNLTGTGRRSPDSDIEIFEDNLTESTQHKENRDGRLADVFMSGSQPVNSLAPSFPTANRRSDTLPIASDDEPGVCGSRKQWGSETKLGANAHARPPRPCPRNCVSPPLPNRFRQQKLTVTRFPSLATSNTSKPQTGGEVKRNQ